MDDHLPHMLKTTVYRRTQWRLVGGCCSSSSLSCWRLVMLIATLVSLQVISPNASICLILFYTHFRVCCITTSFNWNFVRFVVIIAEIVRHCLTTTVCTIVIFKLLLLRSRRMVIMTQMTHAWYKPNQICIYICTIQHGRIYYIYVHPKANELPA